jgi:hypothetical protein
MAGARLDYPVKPPREALSFCPSRRLIIKQYQ